MSNAISRTPSYTDETPVFLELEPNMEKGFEIPLSRNLAGSRTQPPFPAPKVRLILAQRETLGWTPHNHRALKERPIRALPPKSPWQPRFMKICVHPVHLRLDSVGSVNFITFG